MIKNSFIVFVCSALVLSGCGGSLGNGQKSGAGSKKPAPEEVRPIAADAEVLFIGNSVTNGYREPVLHYKASVSDLYGTSLTGIPGVFKKIAEEAGYPNVKVSIMSVNGRSLTEHYRDHAALFKDKNWDVVILQDLLARPLPNEMGGNIEGMKTAVSDMNNAVLAKNDSARIVLYETFAGPRDVPDKGATIRVVQDYILRSTKALALNQKLAGWAPVGEAFWEAIEEGIGWDHTDSTKPSSMVDLYYTDGYHPSKYGSYLAACVFYGYLFAADPRDLPSGSGSVAESLEISSTVAEKLHKAAYFAILNNK
ncbi:MAG: hypothetical protein KBS55_00615 [Bacteroidales bacterium]|nr:hypothetical protein [Candidatus Cryptobacteroides aphodequi]